MSDTIQSLPASWYWDDAIYKLEQQHIFARNWAYVGHLGQLQKTGDYIVSQIANRAVVITRNAQGQLKGFLNVCRHRASPLCNQTWGHQIQFTCPYHSWRYDLNGQLLMAPGFILGEDVDADRFSLLPIKVDSWNNLVFACLDPEVESLLHWLGEIVDIAALYPNIASFEFDQLRQNQCAANWKNYSDNSAEGYHLASIHPGLNRSLVSDSTKIKPIENGKFVVFDITYKDEQGHSQGHWIYKYPGLLLHFSNHSFNVERVTPIDSTHTDLQRSFWFSKTVTEQQRQHSIEFSNEIMDQDMSVCVGVQKNLEAGDYEFGLLSSEREPGTIFFQQCVNEALKNYV